MVKALVDNGASLTVLPEEIAKALGIEPKSEEEVITGAGVIKVKRGEAWIKLKGKEGLIFLVKPKLFRVGFLCS
ncbi:MAG: retroviral-like aspartic protease family protein [Candidatus Methanospirareceae archaeon]